MIRSYNQFSLFEENKEEEISDLFEFVSHLIKNLDNILLDLRDFKHREEILKVKRFLEKHSPLIQLILQNKEINFPQNKLIQFKRLLLKNVEKIVFRDLFQL